MYWKPLESGSFQPVRYLSAPALEFVLPSPYLWQTLKAIIGRLAQPGNTYCDLGHRRVQSAGLGRDYTIVRAEFLFMIIPQRGYPLLSVVGSLSSVHCFLIYIMRLETPLRIGENWEGQS